MTEQYIDVHSHILPGVDDGSRNMEMTMEMVETAYRQGVRAMIATPHYYPGHVRLPKEYLEEIFQETAAAIHEKYSDFTLYLGNEIYYRDEVVEKLQNNRICTLAGTKYVLLEFTPGAQYNLLCSAVRRCLESGFDPVLAHIERYQCLWKKEKNIEELIRMGAYMQINAENFAGGIFAPMKRYCLKLIRDGLVHFVGSDCHNTQDRSPNIELAAGYLKEKLDPDTYRRIMEDNPGRLLQGKYLT